MVVWFTELNPVLQGLLATLFTYFVTALGAGVVFFFKSMNQKALDLMMGFAAGVMISASFWSLLGPAVEISDIIEGNTWLTVSAGFALGGVFVIFAVLYNRLQPKGNILVTIKFLVFSVVYHIWTFYE